MFSHSKPRGGSKNVGSKLLIDHLQGVRDKVSTAFSNRTEFSKEDIIKLLEVICWLHDFGKYTSYFQTYLLEPAKADHQLKSHSALGAHVAHNCLKDNSEFALLAFYIIKMHHSNLMNFNSVIFPKKKIRMQQEWIFPIQKEALFNLDELKNRFAIDVNDIAYVDCKLLLSTFKKTIKREPHIKRYFKVNYLFSLLIESDKLDASDTNPVIPDSLPADAVDNRAGFGNPIYPEKPLNELSQNELRNFVRAEVVKNIEQGDILEKRIFTLAAPTGIGKTMTALDFVLKLRHKIERDEDNLSKIIYGLPFINIIEQALKEYEKTLGENVVMGHYQYADIFGKDEPSRSEMNDEEVKYNQVKMAWDTWQKDVVITSFVQLFETLIGNRNKLLKKFHHFADSIIILDEVQTLAIEKLPVIGAALYYLCKYLNARVLIMTATQPKLFELMSRELNIKINEQHLKPFNLLIRDHEVFACFNRTKIIPLLAEETTNETFLTIFEYKWEKNKSSLIVVNKVDRSIEIYQLLEEYLANNKNVELFYLSTNITPVERQKRIEEIKNLLPNKPCILVSTQVIEAGVDLDFDMGFRDLGPIDSIVQVAGRINRENSVDRKESPLYVVDFGDCTKIYGPATEIKAKKALSNGSVLESGYKKMVERYFEEVSDRKMSDFELSIEVFEAMKNLNYAFPSNEPKKHKTVSDFKIIEKSQKGMSVFVELPEDSEGIEAREAFQNLLAGKITKATFDQQHKRAFNQRIIAVPDYFNLSKELKNELMLSDFIFWIRPQDADYYYDESTGFKRGNVETNQTIAF